METYYRVQQALHWRRVPVTWSVSMRLTAIVRVCSGVLDAIYALLLFITHSLWLVALNKQLCDVTNHMRIALSGRSSITINVKLASNI